MDMHTPNRQDDLSDLERRLSGWRPDATGLDADALLFAAGLAAGRRGRGVLIAGALCGVLAIAAVGLGVWALSERAERQILVQLLEKQRQPPNEPPGRVAPTPESYTPSPAAYLTLRRQMELDPNRWLTAVSSGSPALEAPPQPDIYKIGQTDRVLAQ
jgi:hypothetical protein